MPLHVTTLSCQSSRNYHLPPDWDLPTPMNILTLKNPYVQSVRLLTSRKGYSHFETSKFQVTDSAHIPANQALLVEETVGVVFSKTTNINLTSPTSTLSHLHSDDVHAVGGLIDFSTRGPLLESPDNFSGPNSCFMFCRVCIQDESFNNFDNNEVKLSVNEAKLPGFWTTCRNWAFR